MILAPAVASMTWWFSKHLKLDRISVESEVDPMNETAIAAFQIKFVTYWTNPFAVRNFYVIIFLRLHLCPIL